jgi:xanthine dehydrogenase YagT iron-sulfur-binding subunit
MQGAGRWARILSCLALAIQYDRRSVTTIGGLGADNALHTLRRAFIEHDGFRCAYCTAGQICSAVGVAEEARRGMASHVTETIAFSGTSCASG